MSDRPATLEVLRAKDFRWFFLSRSINTIGSMMTPVTIAFAVFHIDNSSESLGIVLAAQTSGSARALAVDGAAFLLAAVPQHQQRYGET